MIIYLITNTINGKRYIGQTNQNLSARWWSHKNRENCSALHSAILKYGKENFTVETLFNVPTRELANEFEKEYIIRYCTLVPNGYNIQPGGDDRPPMSEEQKERLRKQMTGNKFCLGLSPTEETRQKLRLANLGKTLSEEHKRKISESHKGIKPAQETREKLRAAKQGTTIPLEVRIKMRISNLGQKRTPETILRMRQAWVIRRLKTGEHGR
jgi:group I intron endonuclease